MERTQGLFFARGLLVTRSRLAVGVGLTTTIATARSMATLLRVHTARRATGTTNVAARATNTSATIERALRGLAGPDVTSSARLAVAKLVRLARATTAIVVGRHDLERGRKVLLGMS